MEIIIIFALALFLDLFLGEPPLPLHPVVWMGKFCSLWAKVRWPGRPAVEFVYGAVMTLVTISLFAFPAYYLLHFLKGWNTIAFVIAGALLFKTTFSFRELRRAALNIRRFLLSKDLDGARFGLRALVKREARNLPEPLIVSATAESVAENACDSFVAPLFYFLILGIPGAVAYRVINTLDAMIGLHGRNEYLGKFAARLDDVVNLIPARLTALLIVLAAFIRRNNARRSWQIMIRDHSRTESPNAGFPMSAAAGALSVQFTKVGHYRLGDDRQPLTPAIIDSTLGLIGLSAITWVILCFIMEAGIVITIQA